MVRIFILILGKLSERRAESYTIRRMVFLLHKFTSKTEASTVMCNIIETAKAYILNTFQYLYVVLSYMSDCKNKPTGIEMLLPWSDFIKADCIALIDIKTIMPKYHDALLL